MVHFMSIIVCQHEKTYPHPFIITTTLHHKYCLNVVPVKLFPKQFRKKNISYLY